MTLKLNGSSSGSVSIDAPASTTGGADVTLKLPVADGSASQLLKTDGSGNLGWGTGGKIVDIKQAFKTDYFTSSSTSYVDIPGLTITHTLADSSNKLLLTFHVVMGAAWWNASVTFIQLLKDSTAIAVPTQSGLDSGLTGTSMACNYSNNANNSSVNVSLITASYLYTPGDTSSHTYKLQGKVSGGAYNFRVNGVEGYSTYGATSTLTLMEVAG
tara:strand:+ start:432 stop:1073 length:642 start_codon:yes stop_codon:yes gene_type:complete